MRNVQSYFIHIFLISVFLASNFSLRADDPAVIPDYVNYPKYLQIYKDFRTISNEKRGISDARHHEAQNVDATILQNETTLSGNRQTISNSHNNIEFMTTEIPRLKRNNVIHAHQIEVDHQTIAENKEKIKQLELVVFDIAGEIQIAKENYRSATATREQIDQRLSNISGTIYDLEQDIARTKQQLEQKQNELHQTNNEIQRLSQLIQEQETNKLNQEAARGQVVERLARLQERAGEIRRKMALLTEGIQDAKETLSTQLTREQKLTEQQNFLNNQINMVQSSIKTKRQEKQAAIGQIKALAEKLVQLKQRRVNINDRILQAQTKVPQLKAELQVNQEAIGSLLNQIADLQNSVANTSEKIQAKQQRVANILEKISAKQTKITDLGKEIQLKQEKISQVLENQANLQIRVNQLDQDIQGKQENVSQILKIIAQHQEKIAQFAQKIQAKQDKIANLTASEDPEKVQKIEQMQAEILDLENKIALQSGKIASQESNMTPLQTQIAALEDKKAQLIQKIAQLQGVVEPIQAQIVQLTDQLNQIKQTIESQTGVIEILKNEIAALESGIAGHSQTITANMAAVEVKKNEITRQQKRIQALSDQIAQAKTELALIQPDIQTTKNEHEREGAKLANINSELEAWRNQESELNNKLNLVAERLVNVQDNINQLRMTIMTKSEIRKNLNQVELHETLARIDTAENRRANLNQAIGELAQAISDNDYNRGNLEWSIPGIKQTFSSLRAEIAGQLQNLGMLRAKRIDAIGERDNALAFEQDKREIFDAKTNNKNQTLYRISSLKQDIQNLTNEIEQLTLTIAENKQTVIDYKAKIIELNQLIVDLTAANEDLVELLKKLGIDAQMAWDRYNQANEIATQAEAETAEKLAKYKEIKANYERQLQLAKNQGKTQGAHDGEQDAMEPGAGEGTKEGYAEGFGVGTQKGLLFGYREGLLAGIELGEQDGYQHGKSAPNNFAAGLALGKKQGKKNAYTFAHQAKYATCKKERKTELLEHQPTREVVIDNQPEPQYGSNYNPSEIDYKPPFSGASLEEFSQDEALEESIEAIERNADALQRQIDQLPQIVSMNLDGLKIEVPNAVGQADCTLDYTDFIDACKQSYQQAYTIDYIQSFKQSYQGVKQESFDNGDQEGFANSKDNRWEDGKSKSYPISYQKWDAIGAVEYQKQGYQAGLEEGYNQHVDAALVEECNAGELAQNTFFARNAVLRMIGASVSKVSSTSADGAYIAGDELYLHVKVANFGQRQSPAGLIQIRATALTNNVEVDANQHHIVSIPGQTVATIKMVLRAKIKWSTVFAEDIKIGIASTMPDGIVNRQSVTLQTKLHLTSEIATKVFDTTPKVMYRHLVRLEIKNNTPADAREGYQVTLSAPELEGFSIDIPSATTGALTSGGLEVVKLKYTLRSKNLRGRKIPLTFTVYYNGSISAQVVKYIVPR